MAGALHVQLKKPGYFVVGARAYEKLPDGYKSLIHKDTQTDTIAAQNTNEMNTPDIGFFDQNKMFCSYINSILTKTSSGTRTLMISKREIPQIITDFKQFCNIDLQHKDNTAHKRTLHIQHFLASLNSNVVTRETIREYLKKYRSMSPYTYKNVLCSLRIFFNNYLGREDLIKTFRFPKINETPIIAPTKEELQKLHEALDSKYKAILLMYATTGLRESELLSLTFDNIDLNRQMIIPKKRSRTKTTWITFFNEEAKNALIEYLSTRQDDDPRLFPVKRCSVCRMLKKVSNRWGSNISPQRLRDWFCVEMGELGVPDRFIDAFCGRVPKSILARHYTDYSPERLKRIYDKAGLTVLS